MVRLYDNQAQLLALLLAYVRLSLELNSSNIVRYFANQPKRMRESGDWKVLCALAERLDPPDSNELLNNLLEQLTKTPNHDADLVEVIVETLGLEYSRNRFASGSVEELRKAILLPDELRKVKESLAKKELQCSCGHRYQDGELTTLSVNRESVFISCARCRLPHYVVCSKKGDCNDLAAIDERDLGRISRAACHTHKKKNEAVEKTEDPMAVQEAVNRPTATLNAFRDFTVGRAQRGGMLPTAPGDLGPNNPV